VLEESSNSGPDDRVEVLFPEFPVLESEMNHSFRSLERKPAKSSS